MKVILFLFLFILFFIFFHESYFLIIAFLINMTFSVFRILHSDFLKILIFFKDILIKREIVGVKGKNNIDIQNENKT